MNNEFWPSLTKLVAENEIVIERPRNTAHPRYSDFIYPIDYGCLKGTSSSDGNEVDIWVGTAECKQINGILCTVDPVKKDVETKIIYACTEDEIAAIYATMNRVLRALYIEKPTTI